MHKVLVNRLGGLSLPRKSVVRLTDRPDMTLDVYRGRKTTQLYRVDPQCVRFKTPIVREKESSKIAHRSFDQNLRNRFLLIVESLIGGQS